MTNLTQVISRLERQVPSLLDAHDLPGMAIGICDGSTVLWTGAYGSKSALTPDPVSRESVFSVQSCSKMYTAVLVMLATQKGLVQLDEPVVTYLPEFTVKSRFQTNPGAGITLRHMLSHTAGFTHEAPVGSNFLVGEESFEAHCRSISDTWLRFPVGHHYEYSNLGIDLAGFVLQRVSGLPFHEVAARWLLRPLGLARTSFDQAAIARDTDRVVGHDHDVKRLPVRVPMIPAGGLYTSIEDACRFVQCMLAGGAPVLDRALAEEMYRIPFAAPGQRRGYGLGVSTLVQNGLLVRGHNGGGFGFLADYCWAHDEGMGVVVLTNSVNHPLQGQLAPQLLRDLVGDVVDETPTETQAPSTSAGTHQALAECAGQYVGRGGDTVTLATANAQWWFAHNGDNLLVRPVGPAEFVLTDEPDQRFRVLFDDEGDHCYLQRVTDGFTWYRNQVPAGAAGVDVVSDRSFVIRSSASRADCGTARLRRLGDGTALIDLPDHPTLALGQWSPGLFGSSTGEVLDLTKEPPTYANIRLLPDRECGGSGTI